MTGRLLPAAIRASAWLLTQTRDVHAVVSAAHLALRALEGVLAEDARQRAIREAEADGAVYVRTEGNA